MGISINISFGPLECIAGASFRQSGVVSFIPWYGLGLHWVCEAAGLVEV